MQTTNRNIEELVRKQQTYRMSQRYSADGDQDFSTFCDMRSVIKLVIIESDHS